MKRMRLGRLMAGWSIRETAKRAGVAHQDLQAWETGKKPIYPAAAKRLAKVLGYAASDLNEEFSEKAAAEALRRVKRGRRIRAAMRIEADVFHAEVGDLRRAHDILSRWAGWQMPTKSEWAAYLREKRS